MSGSRGRKPGQVQPTGRDTTLGSAVGADIQKLRIMSGLSQETIRATSAQNYAIAFSAKTLIDVEAGRRMPTADKLLAILALIGGSVDDILSLLHESSSEKGVTMAEKRYVKRMTQGQQDQVLGDLSSEDIAGLIRAFGTNGELKDIIRQLEKRPDMKTYVQAILRAK